MGIKPSYAEGFEHEAEQYISAINNVLAYFEIEPYQDPDPIPDVYNGYLFGRSVLDHHSSPCLADLGKLAIEKCKHEHLKLIAWNPYRVAFVPVELDRAYVTQYEAEIWGRKGKINVGSSIILHDELIELAQHLGVTIVDGDIDNEQVGKINDMEPFSKSEPQNFADLRSAWFLLFEGTRLSELHNVVLSLAG